MNESKLEKWATSIADGILGFLRTHLHVFSAVLKQAPAAAAEQRCPMVHSLVNLLLFCLLIRPSSEGVPIGLPRSASIGMALTFFLPIAVIAAISRSRIDMTVRMYYLSPLLVYAGLAISFPIALYQGGAPSPMTFGAFAVVLIASAYYTARASFFMEGSYGLAPINGEIGRVFNWTLLLLVLIGMTAGIKERYKGSLEILSARAHEKQEGFVDISMILGLSHHRDMFVSARGGINAQLQVQVSRGEGFTSELQAQLIDASGLPIASQMQALNAGETAILSCKGRIPSGYLTGTSESTTSELLIEVYGTKYSKSVLNPTRDIEVEFSLAISEECTPPDSVHSLPSNPLAPEGIGGTNLKSIESATEVQETGAGVESTTSMPAWFNSSSWSKDDSQSVNIGSLGVFLFRMLWSMLRW